MTSWARTSVLSPKYEVFCCVQNGPPARREEGAYLNRYVTDEQRGRRPIFIATLWAGASWLFFRVARSTRMTQIWALRSRLEKQPTDLRQHTSYLGDRTLRAVAPPPLGPKIAHHNNDTVPDLKEALMQLLKLPGFETAVVTHLSRSLDSGGNGPKRPLQVSDRHPDFFGLMIAERSRQFGTRDRHVGRQLDPKWARGDTGNFVKELINPDGQGKGALIEGV